MTKADHAQRPQGAAAGAPPGGNALPVLIDVRLTFPCEHGTIPLTGALRMTATDIDPAILPPNPDIVYSGSDREELVSEGAAAALIRLECRASALHGGISARACAKLPIERTHAPQLAIPVSGRARG